MTNNTVRLALPKEAAEISRIQRRGWHQKYPALVAQRLAAAIDLAEMTQAWQAAITAPPLAEQRVLVALEGSNVIGFAVIGPDADDLETGTIAEFWVDPPHQRAAHGSRLMQACVDTMRADGFIQATWWLGAADDALRAFAASAGWVADGASREMWVSDTAKLKQVRLIVGF